MRKGISSKLSAKTTKFEPFRNDALPGDSQPDKEPTRDPTFSPSPPLRLMAPRGALRGYYWSATKLVAAMNDPDFVNKFRNKF